MKVEEKIPGGKLIKMELENERVKIYGDFFLHPEDSLSGIEWILTDSFNNSGDVTEKINEFVEKNNVELIGFSIEDIVRVFGKLEVLKEWSGE